MPGLYRSTPTFAREPFITWRKKNFVRVLYQTGSKRDARLKDVPLFNELMDKYKTAESVRRLTKVVLAADEFGRPIVFPPGVPADRVKIIRDAFNKTISDPAFLAEAERRRLDIDPATGEELDSLAKEVMTATPDIVDEVKKADRHVMNAVQKFKSSSVQSFRTVDFFRP